MTSSMTKRLWAHRRDFDSAPVAAEVASGAEPYAGGDGRVGVLLCHGFTGSPKSMLPWAEHLEQAGFRVSLPRLPGHGTSWRELNQTGWTDWYTAVDRAFTDLRDQSDQVFLAGLSMGAALALRLAQQHGPAVAGLALVNPAINLTDPRMRILPVLARVMPSLVSIANDIAKPGVDEGGYDRTPLPALHSQSLMWADVRRNLAAVDQPLLVYRSRTDHVIDVSSVDLIQAGVSSVHARYCWLERSYHVATLDYDAEDIFNGSVEFFRTLAKD